MIEQWFKQDIEALLTHGKLAVVCDANGSGAFLMNALQPDIIIMMVHNELEELEARSLCIFRAVVQPRFNATSSAANIARRWMKWSLLVLPSVSMRQTAACKFLSCPKKQA